MKSKSRSGLFHLEPNAKRPKVVEVEVEEDGKKLIPDVERPQSTEDTNNFPNKTWANNGRSL